MRQHLLGKDVQKEPNREENQMADELASQALDLRRRNYVVLYRDGDDHPSHVAPHGCEVEYAPAPNRQWEMY